MSFITKNTSKGIIAGSAALAEICALLSVVLFITFTCPFVRHSIAVKIHSVTSMKFCMN